MVMPSYTSATTAYPLEISPSNHSVASSPHYQDDREDLNSSFNRVFGEYMAKPKQARTRRFCDRSGRINYHTVNCVLIWVKFCR